jgi:DNA-binding LytR/AlgR family response regulator
MKQYTCIITEDEPLAADKLKRFIEKDEVFQLLCSCNNTQQLEGALKTHKPDLLFLDIQMPGISGIEYIRQRQIHTPIIFTTAYDNYALESFDFNVVDYLLKPFSFDRFRQAREKAVKRLDLIDVQLHNKASILINSEYQVIKIALNDILYVEGLKDYVKIFVANTPKPILTRQNLKKIESQLPPSLFTRVHRSYIVAVHKVQSVTRQKLMLQNVEIPIGDLYKEAFVTRFFGA